jgi:hypothetical protein
MGEYKVQGASARHGAAIWLDQLSNPMLSVASAADGIAM